MKNIIGVVLIGLFIVLLAYFITQDGNQYAALSDVSLDSIALICGMSAVYILIQALIFQLVLSCYDQPLSFNESFGTFMVTLAGNYIFPYAGLGFRATYLKVVHGFEVKKFTAGVVLIYFTELFIFGLGGVIGYLLSDGEGKGGVSNTLLAFVAGGVTFLLFLYLVPFRYRVSWPLAKFVCPLLDEWHNIKRQHSVVCKVLMLQLALLISYSMMFYFSMKALNINLDLFSNLVFSMFNDFSYFIRLSPAGIGVYEASIAYPASIFGLDLQKAIMIALMMRAAVLVWIVIFSPVYSYILGKKMMLTKKAGYKNC